MNGLFLAVLLSVLGLSVAATGSDKPLVCKTKDYISLIESAITCAQGEVCATSTAYKDVLFTVKLYKKRCLAPAQCGSLKDDSIGEVSYKVNNTCCNENLCNGAQSLRMTAWAGIVTMMFIIFMLV